MSKKIEFSSYIPYYVQLIDLLTDRINSKEYQPGDRIAGEVELCEQYGVSRTVVRQALREMELNGLIIRQKGRGTFVAQPKIHANLAQKLTGFYQDMIMRGLKPITNVLENITIPADKKTAKILEIPEGSKVFKISRLRFVESEPILITTTYIPISFCPDLDTIDLTNLSLYEVLEKKYGLMIVKGKRYIEAVAANETESKLLGVQKGAPLVMIESVSYLADGRPIELFHAVHRGDRTRFEVSLIRVQESDDLSAKPTDHELDRLPDGMDLIKTK